MAAGVLQRAIKMFLNNADIAAKVGRANDASAESESAFWLQLGLDGHRYFAVGRAALKAYFEYDLALVEGNPSPEQKAWLQNAKQELRRVYVECGD